MGACSSLFCLDRQNDQETQEFTVENIEATEGVHEGSGGRTKVYKPKDQTLKSEEMPLMESHEIKDKSKQIDAQQEITSKNERIQNLETELEDMKKQHEAEINEMKDKDKTLQNVNKKHIDDKNENIQTLQKQLETMKKQHEAVIKEMEDKEKTLQKESIEKASELETLQNDLSAIKEEKQECKGDAIKAKGELEELKKKIDGKDREIGKLKEEHRKKFEQKDKEIMQLVTDHSKEVHQKDVEIGHLTSSTQEIENQIVLLNEKMAGLKKDHSQAILELNEVIADKNKQVQHLSTKLSAEMSTKLASDESNVENVSIKNRPMNVSEEYQIACTDQWLEAKTVLDDHEDYAEPVRMELLCQIIQVAEEEAKAVYEEINKCLEMLQSDAINFLSQTKDSASCNGYEDEETKKDKKKPKHMTQLFKELTNSFSDGLRITADSMDIGPLVQRIQESINKSTCQKELWEKTRETTEVETYIKTMSRICWKMAIQRPPMELKCSEKYLGDKMHDLAWNSKKPTDPDTVLIHVYPMLYHGQSLMAKGKVLLIHPEEKK